MTNEEDVLRYLQTGSAPTRPSESDVLAYLGGGSAPEPEQSAAGWFGSQVKEHLSAPYRVLRGQARGVGEMLLSKVNAGANILAGAGEALNQPGTITTASGHTRPVDATPEAAAIAHMTAQAPGAAESARQGFREFMGEPEGMLETGATLGGRLSAEVLPYFALGPAAGAGLSAFSAADQENSQTEFVRQMAERGGHTRTAAALGKVAESTPGRMLADATLDYATFGAVKGVGAGARATRSVLDQSIGKAVDGAMQGLAREAQGTVPANGYFDGPPIKPAPRPIDPMSQLGAATHRARALMAAEQAPVGPSAILRPNDPLPAGRPAMLDLERGRPAGVAPFYDEANPPPSVVRPGFAIRGEPVAERTGPASPYEPAPIPEPVREGRASVIGQEPEAPALTTEQRMLLERLQRTPSFVRPERNARAAEEASVGAQLRRLLGEPEPSGGIIAGEGAAPTGPIEVVEGYRPKRARLEEPEPTPDPTPEPRKTIPFPAEATPRETAPSSADELEQLVAAAGERVRMLRERPRDGLLGQRPDPRLEDAFAEYGRLTDELSRARSAGAEVSRTGTEGFAAAQVLPALLGGAGGAMAGETPDEQIGLGTAGALAGLGAGYLAKQAMKGGKAAKGAPEPVGVPKGPDGLDVPPAQSGLRAGPANPNVEVEDFVRLSKFALDPKGEKRLADEVAAVVEREGLDPKRVVSWKETREMAAKMGIDDIPAGEAGKRMSGPEMLAVRNIVAQNIDALEKMAPKLADPSLTGDEREAVERTLSALEAQNENLISRFTKARSQSGRDLNNLKILAAHTMDPMTWFSRAQKMLGKGHIDLSHQTEIRRLINAGDGKGLAKYVAGLREASPAEKAITGWKAGILTGPPSHLANLIGNTSMAVLEAAKDAPAYALDRLASLATGQQTKAPVFREMSKASWRGAKEGAAEAAELFGLQRAKKALKGGKGLKGAASEMEHAIREPDLSEAQLRKFDLGSEVHFDNAFADLYTKGVFKALSAGDRVFKGLAFKKSLTEQAHVLARREGLSGEALTARVQELMKAPPDEMALQAIRDAEFATFQNPNRLASGARAMRNAFGPAGHLAIPFTQTPANVAARVAEYSPFGALWSIPDAVRLYKQVMKGAPEAATQKQLVERLGRSAVGTAPIAIGFALAASGRMTGSYPDSERERNAWQLEGKTENSVLINGKWRSLERISPIGNLIAFGGQAYHALKDEGASGAERAGRVAMAVPQSVMEQTFLTGLDDLMDAVKKPGQHGGRYLENLAASAVPNIVGRTARGLDPVVRETDGIKEAVQSRIPLASKKLPAKVGPLGETVEREGGLAAQMLDPVGSRSDRTASDPLAAELAKAGAGLPDLQKRPEESDEAFRARQQQYGQVTRQILTAVTQSEQYQQADQIAAYLTSQHPSFRGQDPAELAATIRREMAEDAVTQVRRQLSRAYAKQ